MSTISSPEMKEAALRFAAEAGLAGIAPQVTTRLIANVFGLRHKGDKDFNPDDASMRADLLDSRPPRPPMIVDGLMPRSHGMENAIGGAGKTTRHIYEAVHIILGKPLYGQEVKQRGGVAVFTKEDDKELFEWRTAKVIDALNLSDTERREVLRELRIHYLTGTEERLVIAEHSGNLVRTDLAERIVRSYEVEGLALVEFDPLNYFGPGERFVNDGEAAVLSALAFISQSLGVACRATAHMSKVVGREGISDAHSGRGGSAGGDNSRFVWNYWRHDAERDNKAVVPPAMACAAGTGDLYRLHIAKLSAERPAHGALWIARSGFGFIWHPEDIRTTQERATDDMASDGQAIMAYLRTARARGAYHSLRDLQGESVSLGVSQKRIGAAVSRLIADGRLTEQRLPANQRHGKRQTYYEPKADAPLDPSQPIFEEISK